MQLTKHHGLGNDFLVLLDLNGTRPVTGATARAWCDRHRGIGADGLLRVTAGSSSGEYVTEVTMQVYERGVGLTEACGTGACAVAAAAERWELAGSSVRVHQPGGAAEVRLGPSIEMTMPVAHVATIEVML